MMDRTREDRFETCFIDLARALRFRADGKDLEVYARALADFPIEAIEAAAKALQTEPRRRFFPASPEWADACREATRAFQREAEQAARRSRFGGVALDDTERLANWKRFAEEMRKVLATKRMR